MAPTSSRSSREQRLRSFERRTAVPMLVLSLVFVTMVVLPFAVQLTPRQAVLLDRAALAIWAVFVAEFSIRLVLAPDKLPFLRRNVLDLVAVALPMLRPLRLIRGIGMLRLVGVARAETSILRLLRRGRRQFGRHRIVYSGLVIALVTLGATIVTFVAEAGAPDANLRTFGATLWWAVQIVTTVGAAEAYPVTAVGRVAAVLLMMVGIGLFGLVAASLASTYIFRGDREGTQSRSEGSTDLRALAERLERIETELRALRAEAGAGAGMPAEAGAGADKPAKPPAAEPGERERKAA